LEEEEAKLLNFVTLLVFQPEASSVVRLAQRLTKVLKSVTADMSPCWIESTFAQDRNAFASDPLHPTLPKLGTSINWLAADDEKKYTSENVPAIVTV
jgi:hypothetical protein